MQEKINSLYLDRRIYPMNGYFLNMNQTARMSNPKPIRWLILNVSLRKTNNENIRNTPSEMASWMTFNWTNENGPPLPINPNRLAGTWQQYSKSAMPQLIKITPINGMEFHPFIALNFKWPYQANVIKAFDTINNSMNKVLSSSFVY